MLSKEQVRYENDQEAVLAFLGNGQARPRMCSRKNTFQAAVAALEKEMAESFVQTDACVRSSFKRVFMYLCASGVSVGVSNDI